MDYIASLKTGESAFDAATRCRLGNIMLNIPCLEAGRFISGNDQFQAPVAQAVAATL